MTEAEFQKRITDLCDLLKIRWHHETDSRKSKKGFPDLVLVGRIPLVMFVELKTDSGRVTTEQADWLGDLDRAGAVTAVWRPADWAHVERTLFRLAGRTI